MNSERSCLFHTSDALARIPRAAGEHAITLLQRGSLLVKLSAPEKPIVQSPHEQDEVYVVVKGEGVVFHDGRRERFQPGDLIFVSAGTEHQFEDCTEDLTVWVIFFGPRGGEVHA